MNTTVAGLSLFSASQQQYLATERPFYYVSSSSVFESLADNYMSLAAPVIAYWTASLFFHILDLSDARWLDKYRIHESAEVKSRNLATRWDVFIAVIFQHVVQTLVGYFWMEDKPAGDAIDHLASLAGRAPFLLNLLRVVLGSKLAAQLWADYGHQLAYTLYWWAIPAAKFFLGMFIIDTWEYFLHRAMHNNTYLYKTFHSVHHRLYVPYAFGALYNHPLEGFLLDSVGAGLAEAIAQMSTREATLLFVISTLKTVDDHCGYSLPWDPLQMMSSNNADYHDIHHQIIGIKSNFAQPFFIHWDVFLGTRMTRKDIEARRRKNAEKVE
ncbi:sphingosine hydroxylase [Irpex lacteus]|nr:sphingosine hydroxylase [Irpex lacteus]